MDGAHLSDSRKTENGTKGPQSAAMANLADSKKSDCCVDREQDEDPKDCATGHTVLFADYVKVEDVEKIANCTNGTNSERREWQGREIDDDCADCKACAKTADIIRVERTV